MVPGFYFSFSNSWFLLVIFMLFKFRPMKTYIKIFAIILSNGIPSALMAQESLPSFIPFSPGKQHFYAHSGAAKPDFKLTPLPSAGEGSQLRFMNQLPSTLPGEKKSTIDHSQTDPSYYNNMPVVKPGKTSKILIARLDPNSPYTYNMPVKKNAVIKK